MSKGIESILVTKQEIIILLKVEPTITQGVPMAIKVRYSEPRLNQQSGNIVRRVSRD
jgi:hypothetical protein